MPFQRSKKGKAYVRIIIPLIVILMLFTSCSETTYNNYLFSGESNNWEAEFSYNGAEKWTEKNGQKKYSNESKIKFILKYKGSVEDLAKMRKIEYSFETNSGSGSGTEEFTEPPNRGIFSITSGGSGSVSKDEVIKVNVKWGDFEESFELQLNNK